MAHEEIVIKKGEGVKFGVWEDKTFAASDSEIHAPRYFKDYEEFGDTLQKFEGELILKDLLTKEMYDRFKDDKTALGVTFDKCIKGGIDKVALVQSSPEEQPAPSIAELLEAMGDASALPPMAAPVALVEVQARGPRGPPQLPGPGHVYGFDEDTQLRAEECDQWQHSSDGIGGRAREPAEFANGLLEQLPEPDRLGMLHPVLDPLSEEAAMQRMLALNKQDMQTWKSATPLTAPGSMPEVQALLASDQAQQEALSTMPQKLELTQDRRECADREGAASSARRAEVEAAEAARRFLEEPTRANGGDEALTGTGHKQSGNTCIVHATSRVFASILWQMFSIPMDIKLMVGCVRAALSGTDGDLLDVAGLSLKAYTSRLNAALQGSFSFISGKGDSVRFQLRYIPVSRADLAATKGPLHAVVLVQDRGCDDGLLHCLAIRDVSPKLKAYNTQTGRGDTCILPGVHFGDAQYMFRLRLEEVETRKAGSNAWVAAPVMENVGVRVKALAGTLRHSEAKVEARGDAQSDAGPKRSKEQMLDGKRGGSDQHMRAKLRSAPGLDIHSLVFSDLSDGDVRCALTAMLTDGSPIANLVRCGLTDSSVRAALRAMLPKASSSSALGT